MVHGEVVRLVGCTGYLYLLSMWRLNKDDNSNGTVNRGVSVHVGHQGELGPTGFSGVDGLNGESGARGSRVSERYDSHPTTIKDKLQRKMYTSCAC